ncbi:MAG: flagellar biosynthesis regulator FlaF [Pseudomonadota bacterium]
MVMVPNAYKEVQRQTVTGRALEREVLERVTARMKAADPSTVKGLASLHDALRLNRNIWMTFAVDLAAPKNPYPDELKASMISLAGFVEKSTAAAVKDQDLLDTLISINGSIIEGLSGLTAPAEGG